MDPLFVATIPTKMDPLYNGHKNVMLAFWFYPPLLLCLFLVALRYLIDAHTFLLRSHYYDHSYSYIVG